MAELLYSSRHNIIPPHKRVKAAKPKESKQGTVSPTEVPQSQSSDLTPHQSFTHCKGPKSCSNQPSQGLGPAMQVAPEAVPWLPTSPSRTRNSKWVKDSDLKSGWWAAQIGQAQGSDVKGGISSGWDDAPLSTNPNGVAVSDQNYSLLNYDGTWAPAPENWDSRPAFRDHQTAESIQSWLERTTSPTESQESGKGPFLFTLKDPRSTNFHQTIPCHGGGTTRYYFSAPDNTKSAMGSMVSLDWQQPPLEGYSSVGEFWSKHLTEPPQPCDEDDLLNVKPWWEHCPSPVACFQLTLEQPQHKGIDCTDESTEQRRNRLRDKGSEGAIERYKQGYRPARAARGRYDRTASPLLTSLVKHAPVQEDDRCVVTPQSPLVYEAAVDSSVQPKVNLYLRRAQISDMAQVTNIYNHYVTRTVRVPECTAVLPSHMLDRVRAINSVSHTFLVACLAGGPSGKGIGKGPGKRSKLFPVTNTDRIIGFAYSDDFNDPLGMYRFLAEVEVYTDPEFTQKGVATCLMDKLIAILDPYYIPRGGYEIRDDELAQDASRMVNCLWINFPYVPEEKEKEWASKWLQSMGFDQTGDHKKVAYKIGKRANLAVFTRSTGNDIDPLSPPIDMVFS